MSPALLPLLVVVLGFLARLSPPCVVALALLSCIWAPQWSLLHWLELIGNAFKQHRGLLSILLVFPLIALLETFGLRTRRLERDARAGWVSQPAAAGRRTRHDQLGRSGAKRAAVAGADALRPGAR